MPSVTRRYFFQSPPLDALQNETDPAMTFTMANGGIAVDATFDTDVADVAAVDATMLTYGFVADPGADTGTPPGIEIFAPGGGHWKIVVDDSGVLSTVPVT